MDRSKEFLCLKRSTAKNMSTARYDTTIARFRFQEFSASGYFGDKYFDNKQKQAAATMEIIIAIKKSTIICLILFDDSYVCIVTLLSHGVLFGGFENFEFFVVESPFVCWCIDWSLTRRNGGCSGRSILHRFSSLCLNKSWVRTSAV